MNPYLFFGGNKTLFSALLRAENPKVIGSNPAPLDTWNADWFTIEAVAPIIGLIATYCKAQRVI
jgi:hypothetical protein